MGTVHGRSLIVPISLLSAVIAIVAVISVNVFSGHHASRHRAQMVPAVAISGISYTTPSLVPGRSELYAFYKNHQKRCGPLVAREHWKANTVTLKTLHCRVIGSFSLKPRSTATPTRPAPPPPSIATPPAMPTPLPTSTRPPVVIVLTATPTPTVQPVNESIAQQFLDHINLDRAGVGSPPLSLNQVLVNGTKTCQGAQQHAQAMANSGQIWHTNSSYPANSFPADVCAGNYPIGQNVGEDYGSDLQGMLGVDSLMRSEQWTTGCGPTGAYDNHICNLRSPAFRQVGIGYVDQAGYTWLVETFTG